MRRSLVTHFAPRKTRWGLAIGAGKLLHLGCTDAVRAPIPCAEARAGRNGREMAVPRQVGNRVNRTNRAQLTAHAKRVQSRPRRSARVARTSNVFVVATSIIAHQRIANLFLDS